MKQRSLHMLAFVMVALLAGCGDDEGAKATCSDAVQNGEEDGVDCGGACGACLPPAPVCNNSEVEAGEECDDGNTTDGDGCDGMCRVEFHEDFEGSTEAWTLTGGAAIASHPGTSSMALHVSTTQGNCGASRGTLTVAVPASAAAIRFELSGNVPGDSNDFQMWMTLDGRLASPVLPLATTVRSEAWCVPPSLRGTSVDLDFVVRTQNTCDVIQAWIDNISITADGTGCTPFEQAD